ncbi:unnamed protein product [Callosobruchus maculatus]|uniref:HAT C-terminal dimerisation domain-containing protein n=1 Tax=Callosobruchus maculatus TaxID=64391 RepID=A0A653C9D9_CALMS|nr:unnamed protein product [Callosobruchus maculatus]
MPKSQTKLYVQKFRNIWLKDPILKEWLIEISSTEGSLAKCKFCQCKLSNKYSDLKTHAESKKHKANRKLILGDKQQKLPFVKKDSFSSTKQAECRLCLYIACHASLLAVEHLTKVCSKSFEGDAATFLQMHRRKCSCIIRNVLEPHFINKLREDTADVSYSLIIDESTDISVHKYLGVCIKYFSILSGRLVTTSLGLWELQNVDAEGIVSCLFNVLEKYKLKIHHLQGLGTDNASVMVGINNGVYKKLKEYCPNLVLVRCVCHSLQLAVSSAAKDLPRNLEFLLKETYDWFCRSPSRQMLYKALYNAINDGEDPNKITQVSNTRWLSIESAVSRVHKQWLELKTHFEIMRLKEKCYSAEILYQMYCDDCNYAYLCFLKPILSDVNRVNKNFESNSADSMKLMEDLSNLLNTLISKVTVPHSKFELFKDSIEDYFDTNCYLGYLFECQMKKMKDNGFGNEQLIRERCHSFLKSLIKEIINRIPDNFEILKSVSTLSVQMVLRTVKPQIIPLLHFFNKSPSDIEIIEGQWEKIHLIKWQNINDTCEFWYEVLQYKDSDNVHIFKELAEFTLSILSLPHSNAEVERLFSMMNIVKTKLRNRLSLQTLNAILSIRCGMKREGKCCDSYELHTNMYKNIKTNESYCEQQDEDFDIFI